MPQQNTRNSSPLPQGQPAQQQHQQNVLRTLGDDKAFYFYNGVGLPLGVKANSLEDFAQKVGSVNANSVEFHVKRHDFENWVKMLGDQTLAKQIGDLASKDLPPLQEQRQLVRTVEQRLNTIRAAK